jgi:hypothetical protein
MIRNSALLSSPKLKHVTHFHIFQNVFSEPGIWVVCQILDFPLRPMVLLPLPDLGSVHSTYAKCVQMLIKKVWALLPATYQVPSTILELQLCQLSN